MSILVGFKFDDVTSASVGLYVDTPSRIVKPALRVNEYVIPGKSGTLDYNEDTYDTITISCRLAYRADTLEDMRSQQRAVAEFLARKGQLVFDDEPDKAYEAKVVDAVGLEEVVRTGTMNVVFRCQPYAESINYRQQVINGLLPMSLIPDIHGTQECPCIIQITCGTNINGLLITRTRLN